MHFETFDSLLPMLLKNIRTNKSNSNIFPYLFFIYSFMPDFYYHHELMQLYSILVEGHS